jgi:NDP-sugar pyrophosphorylase family protein
MRLRPLTRSRPKAMIPVANRPIIDYVIESLVKNGIRDIIIVVGYRKEQVIRYLNQIDIPVKVVVQEKQLGTAHALRSAQPEITDDFLVLPGDNYIDPVSISRIKDQRNVMLVREHPNPSNFGVVTIRGEKVQEIIEKPDLAPSHTVSTGILSLQKDLLAYLDPATTEIPDAVGCMLRRGVEIKAVYAKDWQDAIYPWDILKMNNQLLKGITPYKGGAISSSVILQGAVRVGKGTTLGPNTTISGPVVIGNDCEIGPNCCIMPNTSIGSRVRVDPFTYIGNSLLMDDITIGSHSSITDMVGAEGCTLADHTTTYPFETLFEIEGRAHKVRFGAVLGDRVKGAPFTVLKNCIVGNNVSIEESRVITRVVPDDVVVM